MTRADLERQLGILQYAMDAAVYYKSLDAIVPQWDALKPATRQAKIDKALNLIREYYSGAPSKRTAAPTKVLQEIIARGRPTGPEAQRAVIHYFELMLKVSCEFEAFESFETAKERNCATA